ncbi:MAG: hypothetical protein ACQETG_01225 [Thermodesulfobacteriota bacterium]
MNIPSAAFFPFTFIPQTLAGACRARFGPVVVYQPALGATPQSMKEIENEGEIVLRRPVTGDDRSLVHLAGQFQSWGGMHEKAAAAVKKMAEDGFYNQEFAAEIRNEILRGGPKEPEPEPGPVFNARLFLLLAQEYDRQTAELEHELSLTDSAAKDLFSSIKGGIDEHPGFSPGFDDSSAKAPDPGGYMTESRLRAWRFLLDADPDSPDLLVTSSPAAIGVLQEWYDSMSPVDPSSGQLQVSLSDQKDPDDGCDARFFLIRSCNRLVCLLTRCE